LPFSDKRRSKPSPKNHTKKPTVGFCCFDAYGKIFSVRMKKDMQAIEGEAVARQVHRNRKWTQMTANLDSGGLAAPKRREAGMTSRSAQGKKDDRDMFGGTPTTADDPSPLCFDATRTSALPKELESEHGHQCASMGGSAFNGCKSLIFNLTLRKSLICKPGLTQVVDFHDIFRYFRYFSCNSISGKYTLGDPNSPNCLLTVRGFG
jgi:hypothetical protein